LLGKVGDSVISENPNVALEMVLQGHRRELEEKLKCYDGILSPAQMGQYYAALAEQKQAMSKIKMPDRSAPEPEPAPVIERVPESEINEDGEAN
jgi:hypothetical protein